MPNLEGRNGQGQIAESCRRSYTSPPIDCLTVVNPKIEFPTNAVALMKAGVAELVAQFGNDLLAVVPGEVLSHGLLLENGGSSRLNGES